MKICLAGMAQWTECWSVTFLHSNDKKQKDEKYKHVMEETPLY